LEKDKSGRVNRGRGRYSWRGGGKGREVGGKGVKRRR